MDNIKIKRALISVSDKTSIEQIAKALVKTGCEIISTGGTKEVLKGAGLQVTDISKVTGNPEAFGGRMKTISFQIESALLFDREKDKEEALLLGIEPIDMVICNLYPFEKVKEAGADFDTLIENIDIGGPTMVRAAAKNFKYVSIVTDPQDYEKLSIELDENDGALSYDTRYSLMRKAFNRTADYDAAIAVTFDETAGKLSARFAFSGAKELRYGENSHQNGFFLRSNSAKDSLYDVNMLHGKELSYNNIVDMHSALSAVKDLSAHGCAVIKHNNPCGLAQGGNQRIIFESAWEGDPVSAFGSVIAFNRDVDLETVDFLMLDHEDKSKHKFVEVITAPGFSDVAKEYLFQHKNLRVVEFDSSLLKAEFEYKILDNSLLLQNADNTLLDKLEWATDNTAALNKDFIDFGLIAVRQLKSNAIAVVRQNANGDFQLLGMGTGQPNRLNSTQLAMERCKQNLKNEFSGPDDEFDKYLKNQMAKAVLVSDAFFPFADNIDIAGSCGIKIIIQPGGSIRDKSVVQRCNELGIAMVFTGIRHFKH